MTGKLPKFCEVLEEIIRKIAAEKGESPDALKASLLANIRDGKGVDGAANTASRPTTDAVNTLPRKEVITVE